MSRKTDPVVGGQTGAVSQYNFLRDEATSASWLLAYGTSTIKVMINAGLAYMGGTKVEFSGGYSPLMTAPTASSRIDVISMQASGVIVVTAGVEADSPTAPTPPVDDMPICEVYHKAGEVEITDEEEDGEGYIYKDLRKFLELPATWEKIYDHTLTEDGLFDITGLDLDADGAYMIIMNIKGGSPRLNANADYEDTHYYVQQLRVNHDAIDSARVNHAIIATLTANSYWLASGIMVRDVGGRARFRGAVNSQTASAVHIQDFSWIFNVNANVTSLRLSYSTAGIKTGSRIMIYRGRRT